MPALANVGMPPGAPLGLGVTLGQFMRHAKHGAIFVKPAAVKLGQVLGSRGDVLPEALTLWQVPKRAARAGRARLSRDEGRVRLTLPHHLLRQGTAGRGL